MSHIDQCLDFFVFFRLLVTACFHCMENSSSDIDSYYMYTPLKVYWEQHTNTVFDPLSP